MQIREPIVAGQFYPSSPSACLAELQQMADVVEGDVSASISGKTLVAGVVPHAGWVCSGAVASRVLKVLSHARKPNVVVLFGGVHRYRGTKAAMFCSGRWETPLGPVEVDDRLAERILAHTNLIADDPHAHADEHSLEVQMPMILHAFGNTKVVPIMVPSNPKAHEIGDAVARTLTAYDYDALIIGTTDLTHYGPGYGFAPRGVGTAGITWATEMNDRSFIDLVCAMEADELVVEATERRNACNAGAVAATIRAASALGATEGILLEHTSSSEVLAGRSPDPQQDSVGYAGFVFA